MRKLFKYLTLTILLVSVTLFTHSTAWSANDVPFTLRLVAEADQTGVLRYVANRFEVRAPKGKADRVEATAVATGFELSFIGTIPSAGRVAVTLDLALTLPKSSPGKVPVRVREFRVAATFETADGEPVLIPATKHGPAIVVTPKILADSAGSAEVFLEVEIPIGGQEVSLPAQKLARSVALIGTYGSENSIREAAGHSFVTVVSEGTAVLTALETGAELTAMISSEGDTGVGLEITVDCDLVDEPVATESVLIGGLSQDVQLPVARSLTVETVVSLPSGQTAALASLFIGSANPTEIIIFVTPELLEGVPLQQARVEARLALVGSGGEALEPVEGATERIKFLKQLTAEASEPGSARLLQRAKQSFIVGDQDGETVTLSVEADTALRFSPQTLVPGEELLLEIDLSAVNFVPESPKFPLNTVSGIKAVELPETRILELNTNVSLLKGETIAAGGAQLARELPGNSRKTETVFFGTADILDGGVVDFEGRLAQAVEQSSQPGNDPDDSEYLCSGSFEHQSKTGPDGVEHNIQEALQCRKIVPPL